MVLCTVCAKILARWFTKKIEVLNERIESVEHIQVRNTKSKMGKSRLLNTEPLPGGGMDWGGIEPKTQGEI